MTAPARELPVLDHYDVVVCGGGPAGCAAAITAARCGVRTLLIERTGAFGGAPVTQLVGVALSTNGVDFQGIWHEWARLLRGRGGMADLVRAPSHFYKERLQWWRSSLDPEKVKWAWDTLLTEARVECLLQTVACGVLKEADVLAGLELWSRAGRAAVRARCVIDATGDGIVAHEAGAEWHRGTDKVWPQEVSLNAHYGWVGAAPRREAPDRGGRLGLRPEQLARQDMKRVDPLDIGDVTRAIRALRSRTWEHASKLEPERYLVASSQDLGVRTSRIIRGIGTATAEDAWTYRKRADGIARSSWELDIHPPDDDPVPEQWYHSRSPAYAERCDRTAAGEYFDVPYGALVPRGVANLLVAGRMVSSDLLAQGSLRIQQTCMATGEAAGLAAALSLEQGRAPGEFDGRDLARRLAERRDVEPAFDCLKSIPLA